MARVPIRDRLECVAGPKQEILRQMLSDQLETDRRATLVKAAVHGQRRHPGQIERTCIAQQFGKIAPCAISIRSATQGIGVGDTGIS